jgi:signal transduction histidine kinase
MKAAPVPGNELERLRALDAYQILDTEPEDNFDELTELASSICEAPIALVSLIDETRQWFKSHHGLDATQTPRELAFCAHAILQDDIFEIEDSRKDERFHDNPLATGAPGVIFYAGAPLTTPEGQKLGTLCVIDKNPKKLTPEKKRQLRIIANQVITQLELRKSNFSKSKLLKDLLKTSKQVQEANEELEQFAYQTSHDLQSPLNSSIGLLNYIEKEISNENPKVNKSIELIKNSLTGLQSLVGDILELTKVQHHKEENKNIEIENIIDQSYEKFSHMENFSKIHFVNDLNFDKVLSSQESKIRLIVENLISNAIKYLDITEKQSIIKISTYEENQHFAFEIFDNGLGIPPKKQSELFTMFKRFHPRISFGSGLGLYMINKSVDKLNGKIIFEDPGKGALFKVLIPIVKP